MANTTNTGLSLSTTGGTALTGGLTYGQRILVASARTAFEPAAPEPDLVQSERIPQGHKRWDVQTVARLADASQLTEGVDLAQVQQLYTNTAQITPAEHGIIATVSNELQRRQGNFSAFNNAGTMLGNSLRRLMSKDLNVLYESLGKSVVGATVQLDITHFRGSVAYLMTDNDTEYGPAQLPMNACLHIEQISDIILDISDTAPRGTTTGFTDDLLQRWWRGSDRLYGIPIFHSGTLGRSANASTGALFNPMTFELVMATDADATQEVDNSLRATEVGVFQVWGEAEIADPYGVAINSETSATV